MMKRKGNRYRLAVMTLIGTIIGVGIFGVPYAISRVGVVVALIYFVVLGGIQLLQSLFYAEAAIVCDDKLRLIGLVGRYLGPRARHVAAASTVLGFWGGMVAYVVVGGSFLHVLLGDFIGGEPFHYQVAWAVIGAVIIFWGLDFVAKTDFFSTAALIVALLLIFLLGAPHVRPDNLQLFSAQDLFLPYGVILFSLSGLAAVPEMEDILEGKHQRFRRSVVVGSLIATVLTATFGFLVYGVTGAATTDEAVIGLQNILGGGVSFLAAGFGFLAVATSYMILGTNLRASFEYDYKMHPLPSWLLAVGVPALLFLFGANNFIGIIGFTGAVFGGITAILVALLYIRITKRHLLKKKEALGVPLVWAYISITMLALGALYQIVTSLLERL